MLFFECEENTLERGGDQEKNETIGVPIPFCL
jgi:hypothetical protein